MLNFIFLYAKPELFLFSIYMQAEKEREGMGGRECVSEGGETKGEREKDWERKKEREKGGEEGKRGRVYIYLEK